MRISDGYLERRPIPLASVGSSREFHVHLYDHTFVVFDGSVVVEMVKDDHRRSRALGKYGSVLVPKGWMHRVTAQEDNTFVMCLVKVEDTVTEPGSAVFATGWE